MAYTQGTISSYKVLIFCLSLSFCFRIHLWMLGNQSAFRHINFNINYIVYKSNFKKCVRVVISSSSCANRAFLIYHFNLIRINLLDLLLGRRTKLLVLLILQHNPLSLGSRQKHISCRVLLLHFLLFSDTCSAVPLCLSTLNLLLLLNLASGFITADSLS
jgi:hypothetical protein